jgi:hypothetical protein
MPSIKQQYKKPGFHQEGWPFIMHSIIVGKQNSTKLKCVAHKKYVAIKMEYILHQLCEPEAFFCSYDYILRLLLEVIENQYVMISVQYYVMFWPCLKVNRKLIPGGLKLLHIDLPSEKECSRKGHHEMEAVSSVDPYWWSHSGSTQILEIVSTDTIRWKHSCIYILVPKTTIS